LDVDKALKSVTHGLYNDRPAQFTFLVIGHHCLVTDIKLYCLVIEARV